MTRWPITTPAATITLDLQLGLSYCHRTVIQTSSTAQPDPGPDLDLDTEFERLIDQLIPPEPSFGRRLVAALAVLAAGTTLGVLWMVGLVVPEPTVRSTSIQSASITVAPDGEHVIIAGLSFDNNSGTTLQLADVSIDAPGLIVDRITWDGSSEPPVAVAPDSTVNVEFWARSETCIDPEVAWGEVKARWEYHDRPSWWHRWESLDNPLWNPDMAAGSGDATEQSAVRLDTVDRSGNPVSLDGPLSGSCLLLGIDQ